MRVASLPALFLVSYSFIKTNLEIVAPEEFAERRPHASHFAQPEVKTWATGWRARKRKARRRSNHCRAGNIVEAALQAGPYQTE